MSRQIVGVERQLLAKELAERYAEGEDVRALASSTGRSYGFVHRVLTECGVVLRQPGRSSLTVAQLAATLTALHPSQLNGRQAEAILREVYGSCSRQRAQAAAEQHNEQVARAGEAG